MSEPSRSVMQAWVALQRAQQSTLSSVESALKTSGLPPLSWYDALLELERVGDEGLRPAALEEAMLLPQYGVSRLLSRLEKDGLVSRRPSPDDGRGQILLITSRGLDLRHKMWPVYAKAVDDAVGKRLGAEQAKQLRKLLRLLDVQRHPRRNRAAPL